MSFRLSIYYSSPESKEYLQQVVSDMPQKLQVEWDMLENLPSEVSPGVDAILLEYQVDNSPLDHWIEKTALDGKSPPIFLYLQEISTDALLKALRLGVKECFNYPIKEEDFKKALDRLMTRAVIPEKELTVATRVVSLMGCKGGVGTTFLVTNIAYLLANEYKGHVLTIDLDLRYGQLKYFFNAKPQYTIIDVIESIATMDKAYFQSLLHPYDKDLHLLSAPARIEEAEAVAPEHLEKILKYVKGLHAYTLVLMDAGHRMDDITLKALEMSDLIVLVSTPSIPALSNTKKLLELISILGIEESRVELLINSWEKSGDLALPEIEKFLARKVAYTLESDPWQVSRSINEGRPLAELAPNHPVCRELTKLLPKVMGAALEEEESRWGKLKRLWRKT